nr:hypothetical protein [Tanacetum cinerariifolium]
MSDKNDEINKKKNNEKYLSMVESSKATMNFDDEIADVIFKDSWTKYGKDDKGKKIEAEHYQLNEKVNKDDKGKGKMNDLQNKVEKLEVDFAREIKGKQAERDKGKGKHPDLDDVDLNLENKIKKLEVDFDRMLKAKKAKHDQAKVNKGVFGDEDLVLFNDVNYRLINTEIRMFKERPTRSRAPTRQVAFTFTRSIAHSTRSGVPTASTSIRSRAPTASSYFYFQSIHKI